MKRVQAALQNVKPSYRHETDSVNSERPWHLLHSNQEPILVGVWYRLPGYAELLAIETLEAALRTHVDAVGVLIVGDRNVHHQQWLNFSNRTSPAGRKLFAICSTAGLTGKVQKPPRGLYLLDLV